MSDDDEWYRVLRAMDEKSRKEWDLLQENHFTELEDVQELAKREPILERHARENQAFQHDYRQQQREQLEAVQAKNAEIDKKNLEIERQIEAGTLQPVAPEKVEDVIRAQYDERRGEVAKGIADLRQQEIDRTIGGIDDPEMKDYLATQQKEIEEKYAKLEAERLAAIEREERARLDRALEPYGR